MMPSPIVDFWLDFGSTYTYPAIMRAGPLASAAGVSIRFRPFLLGPVFKAQGWDNTPFILYPAKGVYMWRDLRRICDELGLAFRKPDPFPQIGVQPARVALAAEKEPWLPDFCRAVFHAEFAEGKQIADLTVLGDLVAKVGGNAEAIIAASQSQPVKDRLRAETAEAQRLGIFGAPTLVTQDSELFWGNDRLEQALAWTARTNEKAARKPGGLEPLDDDQRE